MQRANFRMILAGGVMLALALVFFVFMLSMAPQSNDPVGLMQTVGTVSGIVGGIAIGMIVFGRFGKARLG